VREFKELSEIRPHLSMTCTASRGFSKMLVQQGYDPITTEIIAATSFYLLCRGVPSAISGRESWRILWTKGGAGVSCPIGLRIGRDHNPLGDTCFMSLKD
jgi:hypothetical protein